MFVRRKFRLYDHLTAGDWVALQIDDARVGEGRYADQVALQRPAERHRVVGVAEREILPPCCPEWWRLSLRGAAAFHYW